MSLIERKWKNSHKTYTVMQFNILADKCANTDEKGFPEANPEILKWSFRRLQILKQIVSVTPDIVCLEEVDKYNDIVQDLFHYGYSGFFHCTDLKPTEFQFDIENPEEIDTSVKEGIKHGVAIFYKMDRLKAIKCRKISYGTEVGKGQVGMMVLLNDMDGKEMCVAVTHLKSKPYPGHAYIRLTQGYQLLTELNNFLDNPCPMIICGDFNDIPGSPVHRLFSNGYVTLTKEEIDDTNVMIEKEDSSINSINYKLDAHKFFISAYQDNNDHYTTLKKREKLVCRTIDYIWVSNFSILDILEIPQTSEPLPNAYYPSDHLALVTKLQF